MTKPWCVYGHTTPDGQLFYIGSGNQNRPHIKGGRNNKWIRHVSLLGDYQVAILAQTETLEDARRREMALIKAHRPICNMRGISSERATPRPNTVRLSNETAAKVEEVATARLWSFSKTLGVLIEKAIEAKVLK